MGGVRFSIVCVLLRGHNCDLGKPKRMLSHKIIYLMYLMYLMYGGGLKTRHFNVLDVFDVVAKLFLPPDAVRMPFPI